MRLLYLPGLFLLGSCVGNRWDSYDNSSYEVAMEPSEKEYVEHIELLESWSADERSPLPPGLYMELGYWLAKVGRQAEAKVAFDQELARYPYVEKYLTSLAAMVLAADVKEGLDPSALDAPESTESVVPVPEEEVRP